MNDHDQNEQQGGQQDAETTLTPGVSGELVYAEGGVPGMAVRLYREGPGYGWVQWLRDGVVVDERRVRLRLGWEEGRAETDVMHWMAGFVDARTPDALMTYVTRPIPAAVSQRIWASGEDGADEVF